MKKKVYLILAAFFSIAAFTIFADTLGYVFAHAWVSFLKTFFQTICFNNQALIDEGFLPFVLLIILFINSYLDIPADKLKFTKFYLDCFKNPEQAIKFWLVFRFYFSLFSGFLMVSFSIKSFLSLCTIDFMKIHVSIITDPYIYVGKYLAELKLEEIKNFSLTLILAIFAYLSIFVVSKSKSTSVFKNSKDSKDSYGNGNLAVELPFLQALLIVFMAGCFLLAHFSKILEVTMLSLINLLLLTSILACVVTLFSSTSFAHSFFKKNLTSTKIKSFLLIKEQSSVEKKQYLISFAVFLSNSYFINWCILFQSIEKLIENHSLYSVCVASLVTFFWFYLAYRFLWFAANLNLLKSETLVPIPLVPVIIYAAYVAPYFSIFYSSWAEFTGKNFIYSFFATLIYPTKAISKDIIYPIDTTNSGFIITIASPSENNINLLGKVMSYCSWAFEQMREVVRLKLQVDKTAAAKYQFEGFLPLIRELIDITEDPALKAELLGIMDQILQLRRTFLTLEQKTEISSNIEYMLISLVNRFPTCVEQLGSPRSSIVGVENCGCCLHLVIELSKMLEDQKKSQRDGILKILQNSSEASTSTAPTIAESAAEAVASIADKTQG